MLLKKINYIIINKLKKITFKHTWPLYNMANSASSSTRPKVLVTRSDMPEPGIKLLKEKCDLEIYPYASPMPRAELLSRIKGKNAFMCMLTDTIDKELLDTAGPNLKVIGTLSVGFDHINLQECQKRGIHVGNTPNVLTDASAELTVALLLATARRLMEATKELVNGGWAKCSWSPLWMCGTSLVGSTVGIYGLGRIGFGAAERLKGFKVKKILYSGRKEKPEAREKLDAEFVSFDQLLEQSDFIVVCTALTPETHGIFNLEAFKKMKRSAIFINTSRGKVVNQEDLYTALTTGIIRAAGLDVTDPEPLPTDHKLTTLSNCVILPHIASAVVETRENMSIITANNILAGLEGKPLPFPIVK